MPGSSLPSGPRPKRGGEDFARTAHRQGRDAKKARFDVRNPSALAAAAGSESGSESDAFLEADELTQVGNRVKRNAVNIDGYDSDSSNGGFDARAEEKAANSKSAPAADAADDADMFADLDEGLEGRGGDEGVAAGGKRKKDVRFADLDEVLAGDEVITSKSGGHVSADLFDRQAEGQRRGAFDNNALEQEAGEHADEDHYAESESDESEVADEIRAQLNGIDEELGAGAKKKHAPKLDAFNLRDERQEGGFDESLNYVRAVKDPEAVLDNWMDGVSRKDMKKAKAAHEKRQMEERRIRRAQDETMVSDLLAALAAQLQRGETALEALARLGPGKKDPKPSWAAKKKMKKAGGVMEVDQAPAEKGKEEVKREKAVEAITEAADALMQKGETDVYSIDREMLKRMYKRETGEELLDPPRDSEDEDAEDGTEDTMWEYRWSDARDGGDTHGPYDGAMMKAWNDAGYFGEGVEFRNVGRDDWSASLRI